MKRLMVLLVLLGTAYVASSQSVVASTPWTAAFATAAGARDVAVLAPYDLQHPPEYELRPSDIRTIANADLVVFAGYEVMVDRLLEASGDATAMRITTTHARAPLEESILTIAEALGTQASAREQLERLFAVLDEWEADVQSRRLHDLPVVVHFHQRALAETIGMNVVGVFGPAPLEARQIRELSEIEPALIVDNGHNPIAGPIAETTGAPVAVWYNFPGREGTRSLLDIFALNRRGYERALE